MRFSDEHRALFVHVQKTGGSTIQDLLDEHLPDSTKMLPKHGGLTQALRRRPHLASYWIIGFVRNPWDRMVSSWSMIHGRQMNDPDHRVFANQPLWREIAAYSDFDAFVEKAPDTDRRFRTPQVDYLTARYGRRADFVGRTENFEGDMRAVLVRLGLPRVEIPHNIRSEHGHYRDYYPDASRERVGGLFEKDLRAFGYEF